ncbi:MAG: 4a-hydroxytetrahydrobiopterin dehydratase [Burkholderiales bacterium]|nr:4a-hydroxytetrahydrobiopterin dehydratase [Burkholderiales bacterium]
MNEADRPVLGTRLLALASMRCRPGAPRLGTDELAAHLKTLPGWTQDGNRIAREFSFTDYHATIAFVNALAWIAHREDHHPELSVHYSRCTVAFSTHDAGGVTHNDIICAAKAERLFA